MKKIIIIISYYFLGAPLLLAQKSDSIKTAIWTNHFQLTIISQSHAGFKSTYSGVKSLADSVEVGATSLTSTLFFGKKALEGRSGIF